MRAVTISPQASGGKLAVSDVPAPRPGVGEVLIENVSAGVNRADLLQRAGKYPPPAGAPPWPGLEVAGSVRETGPGVSGVSVGDRVVALLEGGGYADLVVARAAQTLPAPDGVDLVDAAALPEAVCTAWTNLVDTARVRPGEWVLIHGGSGGVGTIAVQLAAALGAHVIATAGGPERAERVRALGADAVVDHRREDFVAAVRAATHGRGADVVLDVLGGRALPDNVRALAHHGRLVVIGLQQGRRGELDLSALMAKRATVTGTTLRSRTPQEKAQIVAAVREHVWPLIAAGRVRPVVHARLPLADAEAALATLERGEAFGKVLLVP
ncbi:putative PIG3 family NAD(P)H quinone oxidoreductase [Xylanimonas ulmi]|uniref:Putative PIG3 family NAD(P)H quinone oxidoreductase n=1 Tax=Xylanimonas ulmi TaxID=228973 RepID=A0A4Q7M4A0_9MICO|nr:NAD(P)H-quinone oxidoreductase [Xylanibacterium ulmi]RZS62785.1 putative PIG3 family NAD(P)H quinone oxidoreductase [Xylanibacterium ulmi]